MGRLLRVRVAREAYARVRSSEEENRAARRVYSEGRLEPSWVLNDMCHEWLAHLNRRTAA